MGTDRDGFELRPTLCTWAAVGRCTQWARTTELGRIGHTVLLERVVACKTAFRNARRRRRRSFAGVLLCQLFFLVQRLKAVLDFLAVYFKSGGQFLQLLAQCLHVASGIGICSIAIGLTHPYREWLRLWLLDRCVSFRTGVHECARPECCDQNDDQAEE